MLTDCCLLYRLLNARETLNSRENYTARDMIPPLWECDWQERDHLLVKCGKVGEINHENKQVVETDGSSTFARH